MKRLPGPYLTCHGRSMAPSLLPGDGLEIEFRPRPARLKPGDIVVYFHPEESAEIAHRIVRTERTGVVTRGDNNDREDPGLVSWAQIKGKVIRVRRGSKTIRPVSGRYGLWIQYVRRTRNRVRRCVSPEFCRILRRIVAARGLNGLAEKSVEALRPNPAVKTYAKPALFRLSGASLIGLACLNGNEASGNACVSGPEASGGCKSGAAASTDCRDGAAAGFNCKTGTGN